MNLFRNYHRREGVSYCALKGDRRKAYDLVHWDFLEDMLIGVSFPTRFIDWVMTCDRSIWFSVLVNGYIEGFFQGKKGIRQKDPMSPLLFVLAMEYLSRYLSVRVEENFKFLKG